MFLGMRPLGLTVRRMTSVILCPKNRKLFDCTKAVLPVISRPGLVRGLLLGMLFGLKVVPGKTALVSRRVSGRHHSHPLRTGLDGFPSSGSSRL